MINIVLCGGSGSRLWPLSRKLYPKQFYEFFQGESLFEKTLKRNSKLCSKTIIVTNSEQYDLALNQINNIDIQNNSFILEPIGRNTTAAVTLACLTLEEDDIVLVTPSDHLIMNEEEYSRVLNKAETLARKGYLVTFGIKPDSPDTNYGYIEACGNDALSFKEKPDEKTAWMYLEKGNYYWNSGMFVFKVGAFIDELKIYASHIHKLADEALKNAKTHKPLRIELEDMLQIPSISLDYSIMEKSKKLKVIPSDIGWADLGSFEVLYENLKQDKDSNCILSDGVILENSYNNLIISKDRTIAAIDVDNLIVVDTEDALLISEKGRSYKVKEIIDKLKLHKENIVKNHIITYRPWGHFKTLEEGYRFKVKKISVKPGGRLSLQKHFHRSEHWTIASGIARVTLEDKESILSSNDSIYIPLGKIHRVENCGKVELVIIETQIGDYLEEDDIVRIEDDYERVK
ncbi:mannose-1-phosphate guanylyltransferase/mannose-6-phosphate isomerase [Paramaledivibacter caminithermalis]|uniref:mannose-1-phosphate guanylyltransferase n=1 Tax=Paramaledivibacter caminithermalis (strain DSM 15212 / CIP 107654 / DViRD3) TaxID=1121301 RepID=A0A1M6JU34_PARC5|nr:mannose-1-phosphate guanylyltransferase/mannose-6-phosphate isomerase [Paramaledivibacter caminithermalis]SHJ50176.1 mannose-1-phosphate guanylyltransferase [Paramaledivibacter caminithermalis DSM 15212]